MVGRDILELEEQKINLKDLCEFLTICSDYQEFMKLRKKDLMNKNDQKRYGDLTDQIQNLCSNKTSLQNVTLACQLRDKYSIVNFEGKEIYIDKLPDGYYFIKKKTHEMVNSIRHNKSELLKEIIKRYKRGWQPEEIVVEEANIPYAKIYLGVKNGA